jgi:predicted dehydrogenase
VNIALIGCGNWGRNHLRVLAQIESIERVWCWDADPATAERAARPYRKAECAESEPEAFRRADACVVAVPAVHHLGTAMRALDAGLHVLVEKPLALTLADARRLCETAAIRDRILMVGHIMLFSDAYRKLAAIARGGRLGRLRTLTATRTNFGVIRSDVNVLLDLGPHDIACLLDLAGSMPEWVLATGAAYVQPGTEDVVQITMGFPDGKYGTVYLSWLDPSKRREIRLVGDRAMATFDDVEPLEKVRIYETRVDDLVGGRPGGGFYYRHGGIATPWFPVGEPLENELREFVQAVERGVSPISDGSFALEVQICLEAAKKSLREGRRIGLGEVTPCLATSPTRLRT